MFSHRTGVSISLTGLFAVGLILLLGHPGFALRIANYLFFVMLILAVWGFIATNLKTTSVNSWMKIVPTAKQEDKRRSRLKLEDTPVKSGSFIKSS